MSLRKRLAKLFLFAVLEMGALCGVPISPEQIEKVMRMSKSQAVAVIRESEEE